MKRAKKNIKKYSKLDASGFLMSVPELNWYGHTFIRIAVSII